MGIFTNIRKGSYLKSFNRLLHKRVPVSTQQYYNVSYMEERILDITTKIRQRKKLMTTTDKHEVEDSVNLKKSRHNIIYTLFYSDISELSGDLERMVDEWKYKISILNIHKLDSKANYFNSADVSMLGYGFGVSKYPQFYYRTKNIYQMLPRPYMGSYSGENGHQFIQENWFLHYHNQSKHLLLFQEVTCQV